MTTSMFQSLDIVPQWARMNETMTHLVDCIPDEKLNWSPKPELWNFKGILIHICGARQAWVAAPRLQRVPEPSDEPQRWEQIIREAQTKDGIKRHLALSWDAVAGFLSSPEKLAAAYDDEGNEVTGHWIAYHLLEHDIHHRSDIFHYLALLGIEHPQVGTP
jgi:uncharacterized damage-inducible protein DinB